MGLISCLLFIKRQNHLGFGDSVLILGCIYRYGHHSRAVIKPEHIVFVKYKLLPDER